MRGVDTNILLRFLAEDDPDQTARVERLLTYAQTSGEPIYISCVVLCETLWVLGRGYRQSREELVGHMQRILDTDVFEIEEGTSLRYALQLFREGKGDFADYLIGQLNLARGCRNTVTFDRAPAVRSGILRSVTPPHSGNNCFRNSLSAITARRRCPRPPCGGGSAGGKKRRRMFGSICSALRKSARAAVLSPKL